MYEERASAYFRLKQYDQCLKDCAKALYGSEGSISAHMTQAKALSALGRHEEAARGLHSLLSLDQSNSQIRSQYEKTIFEMKRQKRPDYYAILKIGKVTSQVEIRAAYKQRALELHPDRVPPDQREEAEKLFKLLQEALDILSDDMKRDLYDKGYDKEAIQERIEAAHRAANKGGHHH